MTLLISRIILTAIIIVVGYFFLVRVWTKPIDVIAFFKTPSEVIPIEKPPESVLANQGPNPQEPAYIEGTKTTYTELKGFFPFGYVIFYRATGDKDKIEKSAGEYLKWNIDWDSARIEPDFSSRTVKWTLKVISTSSIVGETTRERSADLGVVNTAPMILGEYYKAGISFAGEPAIYFGTLSDNQRTPIFVLGFRIDDSNRH